MMLNQGLISPTTTLEVEGASMSVYVRMSVRKLCHHLKGPKGQQIRAPRSSSELY